MKKFASILLALALCVAMAVPAFATERFSNHLNTSHAPTGTVTFQDYNKKDQTATVFPAGTVVSLNTAEFSLLQFNNVSNAQDPFKDVGIDAWSVTEFTLQAGIVYYVETFDGSSFAGESFYMTAEGGAAAPVEPEAPAEPERLPAPVVTNKAGTTTIQAENWMEGGLDTISFETLKVEKKTLPVYEGTEEVTVLVVKPGSAVPSGLSAVVPVFQTSEGWYIAEGSYPAMGSTMQDMFNGIGEYPYISIWGTDYDTPIYLALPAEEPAPTPVPSPEVSVAPVAPVTPAEPETSDNPTTPAEPPAESEVPAQPETPAEPVPSAQPAPVPEAPTEAETPAEPEAPATPETPEEPEAPVEDGNGFPVGIVVAIVAVVVIAAAAVVILKKKKK